MNKELIQKFLNKACWDQQAQEELEDWLNVEEFAELIIHEACQALNPALRDMISRGQGVDLIKKHFGVE
jgi:hypothetical protein